jgi:DNA-binding PadR family transcriptional regulator
MTPNQFITWLKGFVAGSHSYNLTPKGWEEVKEKLSKVVDEPGLLSPKWTSTNTSENLSANGKQLLHD